MDEYIRREAMLEHLNKCKEDPFVLLWKSKANRRLSTNKWRCYPKYDRQTACRTSEQH